MSPEEIAAAYRRLCDYVEESHAMPFCPGFQRGTCRGCDAKLQRFEQAKQDLGLLGVCAQLQVQLLAGDK